VSDPSGRPVATVREGETFPRVLRRPVPCYIHYASPPDARGSRLITVILQPSAPPEPLDPDAIVADSGIWEIVVAHDNPRARAIRINAWIQRDDSPLGYPIFGRQSYFDDPVYQRFDVSGRLREFDRVPEPSYVQRITTLNAITTGAKTFVIGGWRESDNTVAKYSALGPLLPAAQRTSFAPNVIARCDDSVVCNGVIAAGTRSGSYVAMNGTSVAAPQVARWIADQFAQGFDVTAATLAAATTGFADHVPAAFHTAAQGDGVRGDLTSSRPVARSAPQPDFK